ncbi:MAG: hypothetical protein KBE23_20200 [Chloroflexi bacterium]|nr:hypothetical protein [Chloroflexota bacterium]MBP7045086.1 hypothetical protein [Chloroflexota bacterium]
MKHQPFCWRIVQYVGFFRQSFGGFVPEIVVWPAETAVGGIIRRALGGALP